MFQFQDNVTWYRYQASGTGLTYYCHWLNANLHYSGRWTCNTSANCWQVRLHFNHLSSSSIEKFHSPYGMPVYIAFLYNTQYSAQTHWSTSKYIYIACSCKISSKKSPYKMLYTRGVAARRLMLPTSEKF